MRVTIGLTFVACVAAAALRLSLWWLVPTLVPVAVVFALVSSRQYSAAGCCCHTCLPVVLHRWRYGPPSEQSGDVVVAAVLRRLSRVARPGRPSPAAPAPGSACDSMCVLEVRRTLVTSADAGAPPGAHVAGLLEQPVPLPTFLPLLHVLDPAVAARVAELVAPHGDVFVSEPLSPVELEMVLAWAPGCGVREAVVLARASSAPTAA